VFRKLEPVAYLLYVSEFKSLRFGIEGNQVGMADVASRINRVRLFFKYTIYNVS
jgi:hypothetical protein